MEEKFERNIQSGSVVKGETNALRQTDVYLLGGQSNAAGYTPVSGLARPYTYGGVFDEEKYREYRAGYRDILYFGITATADPESANEKLSFVRMGMGHAVTHFGPELGFGEFMSAYYGANRADGKKAALLKYAVGSTTLGEFKNEVQDNFGNWMSPSMKKAYSGERLHEKAGLMYDKFLIAVKLGLQELIGSGYLPDIKGMLWMQGCGDATQENLSHAYGANLKMFIADLRADLTKLLKKDFAGRVFREDMSEMPFIIGKIGPNLKNAKYANVVRDEMQALTKTMSHVRVAETADFVLPDPNDNNDVWHFSAKDCLALGRRFGIQVSQEAGILPQIRYRVRYKQNNGKEDIVRSTPQWNCAPEITAPEKPGSCFIGWTLNGQAYDFSQSVGEDITLVAQYVPNAAEREL